MLGLSAGTVITKETMEPNNRVLLKGFIVWLYCFFCYTLSVPRYQRKQNPEPDPGHGNFSKMTPSNGPFGSYSFSRVKETFRFEDDYEYEV